MPAQVAEVAAVLRSALVAVIDALAGPAARPVALVRRTGMDKSLASRLIKAARSPTDSELLHSVPSPTGLRILLEQARAGVDAAPLAALEHAIERLQGLFDSLPGGRQALDAQLGESSAGIRERSEHMARQASFKASSFLFGHYTETLHTSLFIAPAADGVHVEFIEIHRRIGMHRLTPGTPMPLLSLSSLASQDAEDRPYMTSVSGDARTRAAADFLVAEASSTPLPAMQVARDGDSVVFVLDGDGARPPDHLTTAFRVARANRVDPARAAPVVRSYLLHTPCRRLVRDIHLAEGLWPDVVPQVNFYLPGPSGVPMTLPDPARRHFRQLNLAAQWAALPGDAAERPLDGAPDHAATTRALLARAGLGGHRFRTWRCEMAYPVPLIEMAVAFGPAPSPA